MAAEGWTRVSHEEPCPICRKPDNCSVSDDGGAVWCGRVPDGAIRQNNGGQFLHYADERVATSGSAARPHTARARPSVTQEDHGALVARIELCTELAADNGKQLLATELGVSVDSLERLEVTCLPGFSLWPERSADGTVIGLCDRFPDGTKKQEAGTKRGLTFCDGWHEIPGPVLLPEGGSDTAAALTMGLCAVGRPSNSSGLDLLVELLRQLPDDREIVVLGENDRKAHDSRNDSVRTRHRPDCDGCDCCWPGKWGAVRTATQLRERLCRKVGWCFPPDGTKDLREWLRMSEGRPG